MLIGVHRRLSNGIGRQQARLPPEQTGEHLGRSARIIQHQWITLNRSIQDRKRSACIQLVHLKASERVILQVRDHSHRNPPRGKVLLPQKQSHLMKFFRYPHRFQDRRFRLRREDFQHKMRPST